MPAPVRTVLDAALSSCSYEAEAEAAPLDATRNLQVRIAGAAAAAAEPAAAAVAGAAAGEVSIKVMTRQGQESAAVDCIVGAQGRIVSTGPGVLLAELSPGALSSLNACSAVRRAEAPRPMLPRLDEARGVVSGCDTACLKHALKGDGVLVGIVDTGVDWRHPDFQNPDGSTRMELFVHAHQPPGSQVSTFDQFDRQAINVALSGPGNVPLGDPQGHGTHCASIAAGNGRAAGATFRGVAPNAALAAVRSEPLLDTHTIWAIRRIFALAGDRPAVVSLSLGSHLGPHDGTSALENVIANESGPGRIVVVAAGNEGGDRIHFRGELVAGQDLVIPVRIADPKFQFVDVWVPRGDDVEVMIETPDGEQHAADGARVNTVFGSFEAYWQEDPVNRDQNLTLFVVQGRTDHTWRIRVRAISVIHGDVHAWGGTANPSTNAHLFPGAGDDAYSIGMPATEERAVSVGSYISRTQFPTATGNVSASGFTVGQLSPFSSQGPGRYGALRPDIAAPGQFVTAALAAGSEMATAARFQPRHHANGQYITIQGTSMATPFVAGVIALMLQREPLLTPEAIQQRLRLTARRDAQTGRVWGPGFGFGKIDVEALLDYQG